MHGTRRVSSIFNHRQAAGKVLAVLILVLCLIPQVPHVAAQSGTISWSTPENLSNTLQSSASPAIVADDYGRVHVFWSEDVPGSANPVQAGPGDSIFYTQWDGTSWTQPVDILFLPDDPVADQISVTIDKQGFLHVVWTGLVNIYYSKAEAAQAGSAQAWQKPVIISTNSARTLLESSVAVDDTGLAHVLYATRGSDPAVYHVESEDGESWSEPQKLSEPFDSLETAFSRVKLIADAAGRLHAVWQTTETEGFGQAIYYARSTDNGQSWKKPIRMAYRQPNDFDVGWPYIMSVGPDELHLIYNAGPTSQGRYHRHSHDGGATWSEPQHIITEMMGINGYVIPIVDGAGQLHLIINLRPVATQKVGIYYSSWTGDGWSPVVPLVIDTEGAESAHYASAVVFHGNEIHIVWNQIRGAEIWHLRGVIQNVAPAQMEAAPTAVPTPALEPTATLITTRLIQPISVTVNKEPVTIAVNSASNSPLIPAVAAALVVIVVMVIAWRVRFWRS